MSNNTIHVNDKERNWTIEGFLLGVFGIVLAGCSEPAASPEPAAPPPPVVSVSQPIQREIVEWDKYTGRLEAVETVEVRARVSGYLEKANFKDGSQVKKGDLLFVIDPHPYKVELDRAKAELARARARLELARDKLTRSSPKAKVRATKRSGGRRL